MARKTQGAYSEPAKRPTLQMPRAEAEQRIQAQIEKGRELVQLAIRTEEALRQAEAEEQKWSDYSRDLLRRVVDTDDLVHAYSPGIVGFVLGERPLDRRVNDFYREVTGRVERLESILGRLELIPEASPGPPLQSAQLRADVHRTGRVFIVHGHDEEAKQSVARCIEKLDLEAVILHEQPHRSRTIIEKFEDYADVGFAVVLLTPDDVGSAEKGGDEPKARARQNVIFELGFFLGRLGRDRVCALHKGDLELPSDYSGVLWVLMDSGGAWRFTLAREIKAAGLDIDLNKLV